jgi:hypothetical protein
MKALLGLVAPLRSSLFHPPSTPFLRITFRFYSSSKKVSNSTMLGTHLKKHKVTVVGSGNWSVLW